MNNSLEVIFIKSKIILLCIALSVLIFISKEINLSIVRHVDL